MGCTVKNTAECVGDALSSETYIGRTRNCLLINLVEQSVVSYQPVPALLLWPLTLPDSCMCVCLVLSMWGISWQSVTGKPIKVHCSRPVLITANIHASLGGDDENESFYTSAPPFLTSLCASFQDDLPFILMCLKTTRPSVYVEGFIRWPAVFCAANRATMRACVFFN